MKDYYIITPLILLLIVNYLLGQQLIGDYSIVITVFISSFLIGFITGAFIKAIEIKKKINEK